MANSETKLRSPVPVENIESRIYRIRGLKVMLDSDLAALYGVKTKELNKAVKRNRGRFPEDFAFQLLEAEAESLWFQIGTSNNERGGRRYSPHVFTEQGVAMISSVLRSERAVLVNVAIMRAFVRMRQLVASNKNFARRLGILEAQYSEHDENFKTVFADIRELMEPSSKRKRRRIGFRP
jgi:hypothetical protein